MSLAYPTSPTGSRIAGQHPPQLIELGGKFTLEQIELEHIRRILNVTDSRDEAARVLGIDPSTLYRKRKQYGL